MPLTPKIYKINTTHYKLSKLESNEKIIEVVINEGLKGLGSQKKIAISDLQNYENEGFVYYMYLHNSKEKESEWKEFLPDQLSQNCDFLEDKISLVLFVATEEFLFSIIGGNSYKLIVPFIDHSFGLDLYSRIINPEEDEIVSIKTRGITGNRAGLSEQFRAKYRIIDFVKFGKIPQEINIKLSEKISKQFFAFLLQKNEDKLSVYVGKSFKIKKNIQFISLQNIITEISTILEIAPSEYLSSYIEIRDQKFIDGYLNPELERLVFNDLVFIGNPNNDTDKRFQFDFSNPNSIEKYYEADRFVLKARNKEGILKEFATVFDKDLVYERVMAEGLNRFGLNDRLSLINFLRGVKISIYRESKHLTASNFFFHINGEIIVNKMLYYLVDTKWYLLRDAFREELNSHATHILNNYKLDNPFLSEFWDKRVIKSEREYNLRYLEKDNFIVLDAVLVEGVELCDLLYYDETNVFLIHVKYGFDRTLRELTNQITLSAKRLKDDLGTEKKHFLNKIYLGLVKKGRNKEFVSFDMFSKLFSKKKQYVFAYTSHLEEDTVVAENLRLFDSTIAKYSVVDCSSEMRTNYFDLFTFQIMRC